MFSTRFSRIFWSLVLTFIIYLTIYTVNWRYGYFDRLSTVWGLEFVGWVLKPGKWVHERSSYYIHRYVYLVGLRQENENLTQKVNALQLENIRLKEEKEVTKRLRYLLTFSPPSGWTFQGARVIGQRMGPNAFLATIVLDKGSSSGFHPDTPVLVPRGLVGRIFRQSIHFSSVLLLNDPNSKIPVVSRSERTPGILTGQGAEHLLKVEYVPLNTPLSEGDVLVTSGIAGIFPKGIPVARITKIVKSNISLFQEVWAEPLADIRQAEEVLVLHQKNTSDSNELQSLLLE